MYRGHVGRSRIIMEHVLLMDTQKKEDLTKDLRELAQGITTDLEAIERISLDDMKREVFESAQYFLGINRGMTMTLQRFALLLARHDIDITQ